MAADLKLRCSWEELRDRLLANECRFLNLAGAMRQGGMLFGVDESGNPLFTDCGDELLHMGLPYFPARKEVCFVENQGVITCTGYELFPHVFGECQKSPEMIMYEECAGRPFVNRERMQSWLESGGGWAIRRVYQAEFIPEEGGAVVETTTPWFPYVGRGVRRLLRARKRDYKFPVMYGNPAIRSSF